jgi:hypothetical protein
MGKMALAEGLVARAVVEAIGAVAAPSIRDRVVRLALTWSGDTEIPERGEAVGRFIDGPLYLASKEVLGEQAAQGIREELAPVAAVVESDEISGTRPSWPELRIEDIEDFQRPTDPMVRTITRELPLLLVASCDPSSVGKLSFELSGCAYIEPVRDATAVLEGLGVQEATLIVVDCRNPTVQAQTLLALGPEMPPGSRIVLWGERPSLERELEQLGGGIPDTWVCCGQGASVEDVAAVCRVLLS